MGAMYTENHKEQPLMSDCSKAMVDLLMPSYLRDYEPAISFRSASARLIAVAQS